MDNIKNLRYSQKGSDLVHDVSTGPLLAMKRLTLENVKWNDKTSSNKQPIYVTTCMKKAR